MSESKFTKGDWYCVFGNTYSCVRTEGKVIADLRTVNNIYNKHDAHLFSAAPEMYGFLEGIVDGVLDESQNSELRALLAKARGES